MKPIKPKTCKCGKEFKPYKSTDKYCSFACERMSVVLELGYLIVYKKPAKAIRKVSKKRAIDNQRYLKLRAKFLADHPRCAVYPTLESVEVHHAMGRIGCLLCDTTHWVAVSRAGHQLIEYNPTWALKMGFRKLRTKTT